MNAKRLASTSLWERASSLPVASDDDFVDRRPRGVEAAELRVVEDLAFRRKLIAAGYAEPVQSPRGRRKCVPIIRLVRDGSGNAPRRRASENEAAISALPTVEELVELLARIDAVEREIGAEMHLRANHEISVLKSRVGKAQGDDFERTFRELEMAMRQRAALRSAVRQEAFRRIEADSGFAPRKHLRILSPERI
ncbi:MAG TPA: hypothetical protein VMD91_10580 [Candidatus Sulfotelmatobacter sp.]|nr:hypothetical protein [Candidatus Sulfotelmatobacter sp.]